jgi:hypothetical protein
MHNAGAPLAGEVAYRDRDFQDEPKSLTVCSTSKSTCLRQPFDRKMLNQPCRVNCFNLIQIIPQDRDVLGTMCRELMFLPRSTSYGAP